MSQFTTDFPIHLDKTIKEVFDNFSMEAVKNASYNKVFRVYDTDEYVESFTSDEGIDDFVKLSEAAALKEASLAEGFKTSFESEEYGLGLTITHKMMLRAKDDTVKLARLIEPKNRKLMIAANHKIELIAHEILNNAFSNDATPALSPDGLSLINGSHLWKSGAATWSNDLGTVDLSSTSWDTVQTRAGDFKDPQGRPMPLQFDTVVVKKGSANARAALRLFGMGKRLYADDIAGINIYEGSGIVVVETPYLTSANRWFALDSKQDNPLAIKFTERPTLHDPIKEKNMNRFYPATISFEAGVINQPFAILGSKGS